jgi:hypothetical protein
MENSQINIKSALETLFDFKEKGQDFDFIELDMVKTAFREKAKMFHPDKASILGISENILNEKFKAVNDSYNFLVSILGNNKKIKVNHKESQIKKETVKNINLQDKHKNIFLPKRKLRFGEYLYYSKIIDWQTLIKSLVWQFNSRPRVGEIALSINYLTQKAIIEIIENSKTNEMFGETAIRLGKLTPFQLRLILGKQKNYESPIGKYFVKNQIFSNRELSQYLRQNQLYNSKY